MNREAKENIFKLVNERIDRISNLKGRSLLTFVVKVLKESIPYYDWVGFYLVDKKEVLNLEVFEGEPTIHTRIRFGEGICGQAAVSKKTFLIGDVSKETNYLSCSPKVKSEIVVPLIKDGEFIGELDIDSHTIEAFDEIDRMALEKICDLVARRI